MQSSVVDNYVSLTGQKHALFIHTTIYGGFHTFRVNGEEADDMLLLYIVGKVIINAGNA